LYLALLIIGGFLSYRGWIHKGLSEKIDKLQLACLFLLLFVMGLRIGMDDRVISAFAQIGFHAVLFGIFTIFGSVLCVHLMVKLYDRKKGGTT
jgi:uncharacterized membrane protein YbjE (DUF340 family)